MIKSVATMKSSIRERFPTGRTFAEKLTSVSNGVAASAALLAGERHEEGSVVRLPQFATRDWQGTESINLIGWSVPGSCLIVPFGESKNVTWSVEDSTLETISGTITIVPHADGHIITGPLPPTPKEIAPEATPFYSSADAERLLKRVAKSGHESEFELTKLLSHHARNAVLSADVRVHREIYLADPASEGRVQHVLDDIEREAVTDKLLWGDVEEGSITLRLIRRVAATELARRKNIVTIVSTGIWAGAETLVRQRIGDPHLGRVIRRLARALQTFDPERVLEEFKRAYPEQRVGRQRIVAALTAGATVNIGTASLDDTESMIS